MFDKNKTLKDEMIRVGEKLYNGRLVVSSSGNLSARIDDKNILITAAGTTLGNLKREDILAVDFFDPGPAKKKVVTSEFPLHGLIHKNFSQKCVIHCHPPLINGYFSIYSDIKALTFETKLYLGRVPVIEQDTPAVTNPQEVVEALKLNNLVVLRRHGVICIADRFNQALNLVENLEEAVKTAALARIFKKDILDELDKELKETLNNENAYPMFSKKHIQAIVDLANQDEFIAKKGQELDLTLELAIKNDADNKAYRFVFAKGKITNLEEDDKAPFIISAPANSWEAVFLGKLDPFVAVTQGKMKLQGQLGQLARWYVPFSRLFELFKQVKIK